MQKKIQGREANEKNSRNMAIKKEKKQLASERKARTLSQS